MDDINLITKVGLTRQGSAGSIRVLPPGPHAIAAGPILGANAGFGGLNGAVVVGDRPAPVRPRGGIRLASRIELGPQGWSRGRSGATIETIAWPEPGEGERLPKLSAKEILGRIDATWGRMDLACRALVTLGHLLAPLPENCAVVLVSSSGCAATDRAYEIQRRATGADPQRFPYTLPTTAIGEASIRLKLRGPGLSLHGADDAQARAVVEDLLGDGAEGVLFARIETDGDRHLAQAELWLSA